MADQAKMDSTDPGAQIASSGRGLSAGSARSMQKYLVVGLRRLRRQARWVLSNLKALFGLLLSFAGTAAVLLVLVLLGIELTRNQIEIQPFATPKSLAEAGYAPEVAAARLHDALDLLAQEAATAGGRTLAISMRGEMPDIVVPTVGLSLSTLGAYLQHFLGYSSRTTIGGELTWSEQRVSLLLRLNGEVIFRSREAVTMDRLDDLWMQAAQAVMLEISPYRAMLALYDTGPEAAMLLADSIIGRYPPDDENVAWARLVRGLGLLGSFQYGAAEKQFRDVLQQAHLGSIRYWNPFATPASFAQPALFYLGSTLLNRGGAVEAESALRKAIRLDPSDPGARFMLGRALLALNKTSAANAEFTATWTMFHRQFAKQRGPKSAEWHISLGSGLLQQNKEAEGLAQLRWAVDLDSASGNTHRELCDGLRQAKQLDKALAACVLATGLGPQRFENQISLAMVFMDRDDLVGARRATDAALGLARQSPLVHEALGMVLEKAKERDPAEAAYREAIRLAPEAARFHAELGNLFFSQNRFTDAVDAYRSALALEPRDATLRSFLAEGLARQKDLDGAIREYKAALALDPRNAPAHLRLARMLTGQKDIAGAIGEYKAAFGLGAGKAVDHNAFGNLYFEKRYFAAAADAYRAAAALAPRDAVIRSNFASALLNQQRFDAAIDEYRKAFALDPKYSLPYFNLALAVYDRAGSARSEKARIDLLKKACRLLTEGLVHTPNDPDMQQGRAVLADELPAGCQ
jgi:Tfp pilus assembly protein PilF